VTLLEVITAIRDEISEPQEGFVSNAELKRWINRANYDLTDSAGIESITPQSIATVIGTESYALDSDAGLVEQVELVDASNSLLFTILTPLSLAERTDGQGAPRGYFIREGELVVVPVPDGAYTLNVWNTKAGVTLVNDSDTPIILPRFHDLLTLFGVSQAKRKGDDPAYLTYLQDYVAGREGMVEFLRNRGSSRPRRILMLDDVGADGL